jgi:D-beta-D-heptose 7-phosphate kinase/D-beta-D-heptose 1-phosphate adenosyltransferase
MRLPSLARSRAVDLIAGLARVHVLVVGDLMLDRFIVGDVTRISPEAPVPVVRFQSEYAQLGGAANVAHNIVALGAQVTLVGVVGKDDAAARLRDQLGRAGIAANGVVEDAARPTVEKVRVVTGRHQQVVRVDYERDSDLTVTVERRILEAIDQAAGRANVVVVSDYLKGAVTRPVVEALAQLKRRGVALVVDPKIPHLDCYGGATIVTPNQHEAETATHRRIRSDEDARAAAREFRTLARCEAALITRGEQGMWLSSDEVEGGILAQAREVSDVTGAGDTVVATLALAIAAGATLTEAASLANHAAGVVVGKFGPATLTASELLDVVA